jgi:hypothetical protein
MLSVVIPVARPEPALVDTLAALVPAAADGLLRDVLLAGRAGDAFVREVADAAGCDLLDMEADRDAVLVAGARQVKGPWVLVLEPGLVPGGDWMAETEAFIEEAEGPAAAAVLTLSPRGSLRTRLWTHSLNWRASLTGRGHALQGLVALRERLAAGDTRPRATLLSSPVHDRRGRPHRR